MCNKKNEISDNAVESLKSMSLMDLSSIQKKFQGMENNKRLGKSRELILKWVNSLMKKAEECIEEIRMAIAHALHDKLDPDTVEKIAHLVSTKSCATCGKVIMTRV